MMRPRWRKVFSDLLDNKLRTLLVVISIAVGVLSIGVIAGTYVIISEDMSVSYAAHQPANIELRTDNFDEDFLATIRNTPDIAQADGRRVVNLRVRRVGSNQWVTLDLVAMDASEVDHLNRLDPISGATVPERREVILERNAFDDLKAAIGEELEFELTDGSRKTLKVAGIVQDPTTSAGDFLAPPLAYIRMETLDDLHQPRLFNRLYATVSRGQDNDDEIREIAAQLRDRIEKGDHVVIRTRLSKTNEHPMASTVNAILGILGALGVLIVFLSSSLIANTLNALLNQHLRHIGVMKLVGGRSQQILAMYLALILSFGLLALAISAPLGGQGAYALSAFIAGKMGFTLLGYRIVPIAFIIQATVALVVPIVSGILPVINGSRISVQKAFSGDMPSGEKRREHAKPADTAPRSRPRFFLPRPLLISLRNTFRRKRRLVLTLFTLTMGGAIFIAVFNVRVTLHDYIGQIGKYFLADVTLDFDRPYRLSEVEQAAMKVPGVVEVEGWAFISAEILFPDGMPADNLNILAPPADSALVAPVGLKGRWVHANDEKALAVSEALLDKFPDLQPGDNISLKIDGKEEAWQVVGIFKFTGREGVLAYAPYEYISRRTNLANRAYSFHVLTTDHSRKNQDSMAEDLDKYFRQEGFHIREARAGLSRMDTAAESLDILVTFLLVMALLTAVVGSMGLTGTMGMNVLERTREIGIMRAIGANDFEIIRTVIIEGMVIGIISWFLGALLSFPFTVMLSTIVSLAIFYTPIDLVFTPSGFFIWLGLVIVLSVVASALPARNAARLTIREVLAYE